MPGFLVEIDVTKPLTYSISVEDSEGKRVDQKVVYEWTPPFCKKCNKVGHDCDKNHQPKQKSQKKWVP